MRNELEIGMHRSLLVSLFKYIFAFPVLSCLNIPCNFGRHMCLINQEYIQDLLEYLFDRILNVTVAFVYRSWKRTVQNCLSHVELHITIFVTLSSRSHT